ncbi:MAG: hypothetical protein AAFX90_19190 [Pseudomonadota bacterium]
MTIETNNAELNFEIATKAVADLKNLRKQFKSADNRLMSAHKAVYTVLSCAFDVLVDLKTADEPKRVRSVFEQQLEAMTRDAKAKHAIASTSIELKVIRFVCGDLKQKRESSYARVLRVAFAEEIHNKEMSFVDWILASGGVDQVRRSGNAEAKKDFAEIARSSLKSVKPLAPVAAAHIKHAGEKETADAEFCVAVVRKNTDGTFSIVTTVDNAALTKQALTRAGKALDANQERIEATEEARKHEEAALAAASKLAANDEKALEAA